MAINETINTTDFTGAAHFYFLEEDVTAIKKNPAIPTNVLSFINYERINLDLVIESCSYAHTEFHSLEVHGNGDTFSCLNFGRNPIVLQVRASLLNYSNCAGKYEFMELYKNYLRLSAVAETDIIPKICFPDMYADVALNQLTMQTVSTLADVVSINMQLIVFNMYYMNWANSSKKYYTSFTYDSPFTYE